MGKIIDSDPSNHDALVQRGWWYRKGIGPIWRSKTIESRQPRQLVGRVPGIVDVLARPGRSAGSRSGGSLDAQGGRTWQAQAKPALERYLMALGQK